MMHIGEILPTADAGVKLEVMENKENNHGTSSVKRELECCSNCWGWEKKFKQAEERLVALMSQFEKKISELESLEGKHSALQLEKLVTEDEVQSLRKRNLELEEKVACSSNGKRSMDGVEKGVEGFVDLMEDAGADKVVDLMIENQVLLCEKKKAESEVEVWKVKCRELESQVLELEERLTSVEGEGNLNGTAKVGMASPGACMEEITGAKGFPGGVNGAATPGADAFCTNLTHVDEGKRGIPFENRMGSGSRARKQLVFGDEGSPSKKIAPTTPGGVRPSSLSIIDISDSEAEENVSYLSTLDLHTSKKACESTDYGGAITLDKKQFPCTKNLASAIDQTNDDDVSCQVGIAPFMSTSKRKRAAKIVASDSETDTDDCLPISRLRTNSRMATASPDKEGEPAVRRRLVTLRNLKEKGTSKKSSPRISKRIRTERLCGIPTNMISSDDEEEVNESDGEEDDFIVHDSESEGGSASKDPKDDDNCDGLLSGGDFSGESDDASDDSLDYKAIIATIGRHKDHKVKWEFQADMQAAFGKDIQLCMKAVCALYRQQTTEEKFHKATIVRNERGFNQCDARRGTSLGEFLTDGDPQGDLVKSVEELEARDPKWLELCRTLATHYAKQLYEIYQSNEDPLWTALNG
ncbi:uncharacterized protein [Coffea arabica]|uniref:Uncharacterized protein n=1 Tax=Coffea arabica TaxID=13443 RepID=A0ABM4WCD2_COFAR|nr:uncharacterized protein LOC113724917 [Coffea arabica]